MAYAQDVYEQVLLPQLIGPTRPDLVGCNRANQWIVIEAKGRSNGFDRATLAKAKIQAQSITRISGRNPIYRMGSISYFIKRQLAITIEDPEADEQREIDLPLSIQSIVEEYYRPFREWLPEHSDAYTETIQGRTFRIARIPEVDIEVGIESSILHGKEAPLLIEHDVDAIDEKLFMGPDGILVRAGDRWSSEYMRRTPRERHR